MVLYTCQNCLKEFKKKDDYTKHTLKRKNPCQPINIKYLAIPLKCSQDTHKNTLINQNVLEIQDINEPIVITDIKTVKCESCQQIFKTKFNLKRHCDNYCKVKKEKEHIIEKTKNNQVNIDELDIDDKTKIILTILMNQNKKIIDEMNQLKEENKEIKTKNVKLEEVINKLDKKIAHETI